LPDLQRQYRDIDKKAGEIDTAQVILQPTIPKADRLLVIANYNGTQSKSSFVTAL